MCSEQNALIPAPWQLYGEGFILNYWVSPQLSRVWQAFGIHPTWMGKLIQVMVVQYQHSPIGPYDEILILDHHLSFKGRRSTIPLIYVSTAASVQGGRENWGIPKQLAQFEWLRTQEDVYVQIKNATGELSLNLPLNASGLPITVNTHHLPHALLSIQQSFNDRHYRFSPQASGQAIRLQHAKWQVEGQLFPDFSLAKPMGSFHIPRFQMQFPVADITSTL